MDTMGGAVGLPEVRMRELWFNRAAGFAPQGRESDEQLARQLADAMSEMPHPLALGEREAGMEAAWQVFGLRKACATLGVLRNTQQPLSAAWVALSQEDQSWAVLAACQGPWVNEWPNVGRVAKGVPSRVDRLKCLGNAIVPQVAYWIFQQIEQWEAETREREAA
jgi:hypothetical protein